MAFPKPIPREGTSKRRAPAKRQVKPTGKVVAQTQCDHNRRSAQQLVHQVSHFLKRGVVSDVSSIDEAIDTVRGLLHRIQLFKVQHLTTVAGRSMVRPKQRKRQ